MAGTPRPPDARPALRAVTTEEAGGAVRGEVRAAGFRRVSHGLYRSATQDNEIDELVRDLKAFRLVLPVGAVFTHVTAARLRGWDLPHLPDQVPVFAAVLGDVARPRRPGLVVSRVVGEPSTEFRHGVPVARAEEICLRAARDLGVLDLAIMISSALRADDLDPAAMETLLATRRPGVRRLRAAWHLADARCESAGEVLLRVMHEAFDVPTTPQVELVDDQGTFLGRADLLVQGTRLVHEYDGAHHRSGEQQRTDLRRERGFGTSYTRRGFTLDDLLNHPVAVMHEIDRALERPHRLERLRRWRSLVDQSCYAPQCRERLHLRWQRLTGHVEWQPAG